MSASTSVIHFAVSIKANDPKAACGRITTASTMILKDVTCKKCTNDELFKVRQSTQRRRK